MTTPVLEPQDSPTVGSVAPAGAFWTASRVRLVALALVAVQLLVRGWTAFGRDYYWDDLTLLYRADRYPLFSATYLLHQLDGHFMPGAFLLAGLVERVAPFAWWPAALTIVVLQVLASLALLRLLRVLLGDRPLLLVPLAFGLFTPISLGSTMWWTAALNALPLQIGLALFLADAVLLARGGNRRHALTGTLVLALTFTFYVKAVLVPWTGFAVVALVLMRDGHRSPVVSAWRRARALWVGSLAVTLAWALAYLATRADDAPGSGGPVAVLQAVRGGVRALAPAVFGGPFGWVLTPPGEPLADVPAWTVGAGATVVLLACVWTVVHLRGALAVWALVVVSTAAGQAVAAAGRGASGLGDLLPLAYRYFAADSVVLAVAGALLASLPRRAPDRVPVVGDLRVRTAPLVGALTAVFVLVALASTVDNARAWRDDQTGDYLDAARTSLAAAGSAPLLDQPLPESVMWNLNPPQNLISHTLAALPDRPPFAAWTDDLRMLDDRGRLVPAHVAPGVLLAPGTGDCGTAASGGSTGAGSDIGAGSGSSTVPLASDLFAWEWTVQLDYVADRDGEVTVGLDDGVPVEAPVQQGSHSLYVRLDGAATAVQVDSRTPGLGICVRSGVVGTVAAG